MLYSNINDFEETDYKTIRQAVQLLLSMDFTKMEDGRINVDETTYIQILSYVTEDISNVQFERHHNRFDIHYMVEGSEKIYLSSCISIKPVSSYDAKRDIVFLETPPNVNEIVLQKGDFLLIGMDEPHKTNGWINGKEESVKKVVIKTMRK